MTRFYQHYRTHVAPFNPILFNAGRFELDLSVYLKAEAAGELKDRQQLVEGKWISRKRISFVALLLSVLASGAHFSDALESTNATHSFGTVLNCLAELWETDFALKQNEPSRRYVWQTSCSSRRPPTSRPF